MKHIMKEIADRYYYDGETLRHKRPAGRYGRYPAGSVAGSINNQGIRMVYVEGKRQFSAHQVIWALHYGQWPDRVIRHIDGNLLNNRICNLRMDDEQRKASGKRPTISRLREMLKYDPDTGDFHWIRSPRNRTMPGDKAGYLNGNGYLCAVVDRYRFNLHRVAFAFEHNRWPRGEIDHINRIRDDNRICNLREVSRAEQVQNMSKRSDNTSGYTGVHFRKDTKKYVAQINAKGKTYILGNFDNIDDAIAARHEAELVHHPLKYRET